MSKKFWQESSQGMIESLRVRAVHVPKKKGGGCQEMSKILRRRIGQSNIEKIIRRDLRTTVCV